MHKSRFWRLIGIVLTALLLASCGGGEEEEAKPAARGEGCPKESGVQATFLPAGFERELKDGPAPDKPALKKGVAFHYAGGTGKYIEIIRGGGRTKFKKATRFTTLGDTVRMNKLAGDGYGAKVRFGLGACSRYQFEGFGVSEEDFKKVIDGLKRVPSKPRGE